MKVGRIQTLVVSRISDYGLYLKDDEESEVLLPNRFVSLDMKVGDSIEVFVYHDSEDRLVASTERPKITEGCVAWLEVVDKSFHGAFLDWGLSSKHLFLPNRNQQGGIIAGRKTLVYMYVDQRSGRCVATNKFKAFVYNDPPLTVEPGRQVGLLVASESPIGYRVIIDNRHWGMLYKNEVFRPVAVGDTLTGYVHRITEDCRIDVRLQQSGLAEVERSTERLLQLLERGGGRLPLNDGSDPQRVAELTNMSKKVFKRSVGMLLKRGAVKMNEQGIELIKHR